MKINCTIPGNFPEERILQEIECLLKKSEILEANPPKEMITYAEFMRRRGTPID